jgi:glycosyltransferase involved in cell wall biosynthesis
MTARIFVDGFNLSLEHGTGIATYSRMLTRVASQLGYQVGILYGTRRGIAKNGELREIAFFDREDGARANWARALRSGLDVVVDHLAWLAGRSPTRIDFTGLVVSKQFESRLPVYDAIYASRNVFSSANGYFHMTNRFGELSFDRPPDIFHWTYQLPLRARGARNVYTIHDLVPLRLPFATLENKRHAYRLLRAVARRADHIVTVSESSKRDIMRFLDVPEERVTNTYQAVEFSLNRELSSPERLAEQLEGSYGLETDGYLLFFGAMEPKKNVARLIEAYLSSGATMPLVLISSGGWQNETELKLIRSQERIAASRSAAAPGGRSAKGLRREILHLDYVSRQTLVTLIRGARAVLFPSLYEGFGLPVLEAMVLGTAVVTSRESSLPEIAGDAALLVDPYDVGNIAAAIRKVAGDADLAADLAGRGRTRAELFSVDAYRARMAKLYASLR